VDFCDLNLCRAAIESTAKAAEILCLAKRLNLKGTLEKLRTEFSKCVQIIITIISHKHYVHLNVENELKNSSFYFRDNELLFQCICP